MVKKWNREKGNINLHRNSIGIRWKEKRTKNKKQVKANGCCTKDMIYMLWYVVWFVVRVGGGEANGNVYIFRLVWIYSNIALVLLHGINLHQMKK